jgi:hypothetical protein
MGLDLTEQEFDLLNAEKTQQIQALGVPCESYASKTCPTIKGFWMQIVEEYKVLFSQEQIAASVEYVPIVINEEIIEL